MREERASVAARGRPRAAAFGDIGAGMTDLEDAMLDDLARRVVALTDEQQAELERRVVAMTAPPLPTE